MSTAMALPNESTGLLGQNGNVSSPPKKKLVLYIVLGFLVGGCLGAGLMWCLYPKPETQVDPKIHRNSKYTATQFLSFSINTFGGLEKYGECEGRFVDDHGSCYLGNQTDLSEDLDHRFSLIQKILSKLAVDESSDMPKIDHSPNVLKIFALPEFFLRGPFGAYSLSDLQKGGLLVSIGDRIYDLIKDPKYDNWLFVFGTVILAQSVNNPNKPWEVEDQFIEDGEILYFNFAPIVKGGSGMKNYKFQLFKDYISTIDFLDRKSGLPNPRRSDVSEYNDLFDIGDEELKDFLLNERGVHVVSDNVVEIEGIRFGMEICLDHRVGVLWDKLQETKADLVDVLLIISAGMAIERGPNPIRPGGVVYLTDGGGSSAACLRTDYDKQFDPESVCREGPNGLSRIPLVHSTQYNSFIAPEHCFVPPDEDAWKAMVSGYYSNYREQGCAYTLNTYGINVYNEKNFYPPSLEVYPTIALP